MKPKKVVISIFTLILIILVVTAIQTYRNTLKASLKLNSNIISSPIPSPFPKTSFEINPKTNRTIYTNAAYNFSFEFPQNLFVYRGEQPYALFLSNKENGESPMELGADGLWLNMSFEPHGPTMEAYYRKIFEMPIGSINEQTATTKLSNFKTNGITGTSYYQGVPPSFAGEPAYTYEAIWIKGKTTYKLSLSAIKLDTLKQYKPTFDQILSTFQFTDSQ